MKKIIIASIASALLAVGAYAQISSSGRQDAVTQNKETSSNVRKQSGRYISQDDFTRAAESTVNGVVSVKSYVTPQQQRYNDQSDYYNDPFFEFFFGSPRRRQQAPQQQEPEKPRQIGLGSGVIISNDGYIVTNNHVIAQAERLEVTLNDNRNYEATVIGADEVTDLALIRIDAPDLHVIPMGNSENLKVGEWVLAVGNPFGFTSTVTSGIVSAKARNISSSTGMQPQGGIESYIQTDAAVNRGNSGGALVNLDGELVGINTAIYSQTGTYAGCSFAIPTTIVQKVIADLKKYGTVQRAYLGISLLELSPELISEKDIKGTTSGIYVATVEERSAAMEAGVQVGDVIVAINDYSTRSVAELQESITRFSPGDKVDLKLYRDGKLKKVRVTLRNNKGDVSVTRPDNEASLGATFAKVDKETLARLEITSGVAVKEIDESGRFHKAGIRQGLIILSINGTRVNAPEDISAIFKSIRKSSERDKVMFITGVYPTGRVAYYAVPLND